MYEWAPANPHQELYLIALVAECDGSLLALLATLSNPRVFGQMGLGAFVVELRLWGAGCCRTPALPPQRQLTPRFRI